MLDQTMRAKLLPAPLIISDFVHNEPNCNYELYLLELLNKSNYFAERYPGGFKRPTSESHGECDAINENYQIDFKLLAAKTALMARSILSPQVEKIADGATAFYASKVKGRQISSTRIYAAFRGQSYEELVRIRNIAPKASGIDNDIFTVLETLETKKNLLLFFPYEFSFDKPHTKEEAIFSISQGLNKDFKEAFKYREWKANGYDTFLLCLYNDIFLVFEVNNQEVVLCEMLNSSEINTFADLCLSYTDKNII